jgi:hypothetical protein
VIERRNAGLAVGDVLAIVGVLVVGELTHGVSPLAQPLRVADTLAPFVGAYLAAALVVGTYRAGGRRRLLAAWLVGTLGGLSLRATPLFHGGVTWPFPAVVLGTTLVALVGWRTVRALLDGRGPGLSRDAA